ncbi:copper resistance protein CopC [Saccharopolyspora mangrovi]|uniref:Copper resistance protein CopC n=1 Tax=Saccharopolyspora mangrovi TaxID=3082379 RepID=A0ABU6AEY4_9PSEU|nr:copper resistance protein CopC [Saccharopolyspora sp. S2-29]MEB3370106.1 copper resistance protein CopC [Saccharopolyspora sp. S2-29]
MTAMLTRQRPARRDIPRPPMFRRVLAVVLFVAVCWGALLATMPAQQGNPVLRSTSPGNAENVKSPDEVLLRFDRPVPAGLATIRIISPPGDQVVFTRPYNPAGQDDTVAVAMPPVRYGGTYTVAWALPSDRLEQVAGVFTFDVVVPSTPVGVPEIAAEHDPWVTGAHVTARVAALGAMALLIGAAVFVAALQPATARSRPVRRVLIWSGIGTALATIGTLATFGPYAAWVPLGDAFDPALFWAAVESPTGRGMLSRLALLVPVLAGLVWLLEASPAETRRARLMRGVAALGGGAALAATWPLARTRPIGSPTPLEAVVDTATLTAAAVGITSVLLIGLAARSGHREPEPVVPRLIPVLAACSALLACTGGYHVWQAVRDGEPAWLAIGLVALAVLLVVLSAVLRIRMRRHRVLAVESVDQRRAELRTLRTAAGVGIGVAAVLVGATSALVLAQAPDTAHARTDSPTPASIRQQSGPFRLAYDTGKPGGQGSIDLALIPAEENGRIRLDTHITVLDEVGHPTDEVRVTGLLARERAAPAPLELRSATGPGHSVGAASLPEPGKWAVVLNVRTPDGGAQTVAQPLDVH